MLLNSCDLGSEAFNVIFRGNKYQNIFTFAHANPLPTQWETLKPSDNYWNITVNKHQTQQIIINYYISGISFSFYSFVNDRAPELSSRMIALVHFSPL